jgi:hypothetical protein
MNNLDFIARLAKDGLYNLNYEHCGGGTDTNLATMMILKTIFDAENLN